MSVGEAIEEIVEEAEEIAGTLIGDVEAVLRPRPGGKIDTSRRQRDANSLADEPVADQDYLIKGRPVAVDSLAADTGIAITVTLTANNPVRLLLPRDTTRRGAVILAVDNPVYVAVDANLAKQAEGSAASSGAFYLPVGIPVPVGNTAELWVSATTTGTSSRVSAMSDIAGIR